MPIVAALLLALIILVVIFELLRRKVLREKYAVLWLVVGVATLVLAAFPGLLDLVANALHVQVPSNLLFALSIILALGVCLHLSWEISIVESEIRTLAEESAIQRAHITRLENRVDALSATTQASSPDAAPGDAH